MNGNVTQFAPVVVGMTSSVVPRREVGRSCKLRIAPLLGWIIGTVNTVVVVCLLSKYLWMAKYHK